MLRANGLSPPSRHWWQRFGHRLLATWKRSNQMP
jgi:hypothetical protein